MNADQTQTQTQVKTFSTRLPDPITIRIWPSEITEETTVWINVCRDNGLFTTSSINIPGKGYDLGDALQHLIANSLPLSTTFEQYVQEIEEPEKWSLKEALNAFKYGKLYRQALESALTAEGLAVFEKEFPF